MELSTTKIILRFGLPLCLTFVIQQMIIMVDSAFAGHISYSNLAAVALGSNSFFIFFFLVVGVCIASSVKAGHAFGANDDSMLNFIRQGTLLCCALSLLLSLALINSSSIMLTLGQDSEVVGLSNSYLAWFAWTLPIQGLIILYRSYFAVINRPWAGLWPMVNALLLNTFLDYCLTTGNLGFPAMGIAGIGLASFISNAFLLILMLRYIGWSTVYKLFQFFHPDVWANGSLWKLLLIAVPISITLVAEEAFFAGSAYLAGFLGVAEQAAHQILLNTIGTSYLFNTGIATACSILISKYMGAKQFDKIINIVMSGWTLMLTFTLPFALVLLFFGDVWISLFLDETHTRNHATILFVENAIWLAIAMLFIDVTWLVMIESLHGMLDATFPAWCTLGAYWLIGGTLAWWSTQYFIDSFLWIWISMLVATCVLTILVWSRFFYKLNKLPT